MTEQKKSTEQVIDNIQKLLNMTETKGCTEAEAANAAAMVQKLLFKYKLEMADIEAHGEKVEGGIGRDDLELKVKAHEGSWRMQLLFILARYNFCKAISRAYPPNTAYIIGKPTEVQIVKELHSWISEQLETICKDYIRQGYNGPDRVPTFRRSFFTAAIETIRERLAEQQREMAAQTEQSTALVVVSGKELQEWVSQNLGPLGRSRSSGSFGSFAGGVAGTMAGRQIDLNRPSPRLH